MSTTLPGATDYTGSSVTQGGKKTFMTGLRAFIAAAIGIDTDALSVPNTLALHGGINASAALIVDKTGSVAKRLRAFIGDGSAGTVDDDVYIAGANATVHIMVGASGTTEVVQFGNAGVTKFSGTVAPISDNTKDLGTSALGWHEIFCDNGTINTSDARVKTAVREFTKQETEAAKLLGREIGIFQMLAAVGKKGDSARMHIGMTVQRAIEIMKGCGLDPFAYSFVCYDVWEDEFIDHPETIATPAQVAVPASLKWSSIIVKQAELPEHDKEGNLIKSGSPPVLDWCCEEVAPAVPSREATVSKPAWREQVKKAGDRYAFRVHELLLFIAAGQESRLAALEAKE